MSQSQDIAVVGMAVRVPGAASAHAFWQNLKSSTSSIRRLSEEELRAAGVSEGMLSRSDYVPFAAPLEGFSEFDAEFFGLSPKEAAVMDPQHRQFLETAWEAMEIAGHPPESVSGQVGVFAGCGMGSYFYWNVCSHRDLVADTGLFLLRHTGNDKDFMATRASHIFDLKGPAIGMQTACSTSLVAIHYAAQALLAGDCDMALAGGSTIELPQGQGYLFKKDEILSPDGTCRAFDHRAEGTVFGSGTGVVALRRLEDAIADGDHIWAVLKGSAVNNDGAVKASYLAPSVEGQAAAIRKAQKAAGVDPDTVDYVECHGTGTYLGDPIEVAALTEAFGSGSGRTGPCRIGSVKTNIGHLDTAAGVASFVKASLALHHKALPASLNFEAPNPAIDFENSPFEVNSELTPWDDAGHPRRAGVNSLGVGGTNAHAVLEEAPARAASEESDWPFQLLTLSARSKSALDQASDRLADWLEGEGAKADLADVAFTLKEGRRAFEHRRVVVAETAEEAARELRAKNPRRVFTHSKVGDGPDTVFMFPGGGAQYAGMARDLYDTEPVFREWMDKGLEILAPQLDYDIRAIWLPEEGGEAEANARLQAPSVQLPLIMITEYALAQLWMSWGVTPSALIGHSMGENTAACVAGVMSFEDCIGLVLLRGRLFETVEKGGMLSVPLPEADLIARMTDDLDLASVNSPNLSVVSGPQAALDRFAEKLLAEGIETRRIQIDIAAHSRLLEPILGHFRDYLAGLDLKAPRIPIVSNRSGSWLTDEEATDPDYWVGHLRNTVHFFDGITTLAERPNRIFIEVGPGVALASLAGQHGTVTPNQVVGTLRHPEDPVADDMHFMAMLGRVWAAGGAFDWSQIWGEARRNRLPMPTYPFQHRDYYIAPAEKGAAGPDEEVWLSRLTDRDDWTWRPVWKPAYADTEPDIAENLGADTPETWLVFEDETGLLAGLSEKLRKAGHIVTSVVPGDAFSKSGENHYAVAVEQGQHSFTALLADLADRGRMPTRMVHGWLITGKGEKARPGSSFFHRIVEEGFWSLFHFARAWGEADGGGLHINVITSEASGVAGTELRYPAKATVAGPARVIPREFPGVTVSMLDIPAPGTKGVDLSARIAEEVLAAPSNTVAALGAGRRYEQIWRPVKLPAAEAFDVTPGQTVLLTGGLGGIGLTLAAALIEKGAKVAILTRAAMPPREDWARIARLAPENHRLAGRIKRLLEIDPDGASLMVVSGDVSNIDDMTRAKDEIEASFGPVKGVVHAAGVIADALMLGKDAGEVEAVFTPKIYGTQVLSEVFPDGTLDWLALFSSSSTATAPAGQVDYVAANAYLNAVGQAAEGGKTRVVTLNWGPWAEVGMAVEALSRSAGEDVPIGAAVSQPLLDLKSTETARAVSYLASWTTGDRWVLDEHRTRDGDALLPGTGYVELAAEALAASGRTGGFEITDLTFLTPLRTPDDTRVSVRVSLKADDGGHRFEVESAAGGDFTLNAEASVAAFDDAPGRIDVAAIAARMGAPERAPEGGAVQTSQSVHLNFGPRWQVVKSMAFGKGEALAELEAPIVDEGYLVHPGMLDLGTGFALPLVPGYSADQFWVPLTYGKIRVYGPLPQKAVSWVRSKPENSAETETVRFDVTIADQDGNIALEIENFTVHRLKQGIDFAKSASAQGQPDPALSPAQQRLKHNVEQGILPADGAEMFFRALASDAPQVLVSSLDLPSLIREADKTEAAGAGGASFERPDLDSEFAEPETPIEKKLVEFWAELLGVSEIGIDDNFFDLGGHSLIAVRLFAKVKAAYAVDFPISILFEAPTVRTCAALIAERTGDDGSGAEDGAAAAEKKDDGFLYLVPMHGADVGEGTPFFMVAGMFGNILNLRHLGHLVGPDRPFYGLQARGLFGGADPHTDLRDAARDYIEEIRRVQPHGPYMVGGFSGGGLTAFEIARQLREAGEEIASVILLDTPLPVRPVVGQADRIRINMALLRENGPGYPLDWAKRRIAWEFQKRKAVEFETSTTEFHNEAIRAAFIEAIGKYEVKHWEGPLTLFRPPLSRRFKVGGGRWVSEEREYVIPDNGWTEYVPTVEVIEVPGDHDSMVLEPNVRVLVARLRKVLDESEAGEFRGIALKAAE